jgi:N-acetylneuraminate synthase
VELVIDRKPIGPGQPCFVIGEIGQAHDGSLGFAHAFIDAIADAGADAVKLQTHIAEAESTAEERWRVPFSRQDGTRLDYWRRTAFRPSEWRGLAEHAAERGLVFLSSPFSPEAVDLLDEIGVGAWKIASGEVLDVPMLDRLAGTDLPVLLSTGMSDMVEIDRAVALVRARGLPIALLQCTSMYPTPPERVGLNLLTELRERHACPVGLSDHSGTVATGVAAVALGADLLEVHVAFSRKMFGPDVSSSLLVEELEALVRHVRHVETVLAHPVDKDLVAKELAPLRELFTKSLVPSDDLSVGTVLDRTHLRAKKPGTGIAADRIDEIVGRRLRRAVARDQLLTEDDLEPEAP